MKSRNLLLASASLTIFSLSIILFQISCKKEATAQNSTNNCLGLQPKLQFKANGSLYVCDALFDNRVGWYGNYTDQLHGEGGGELPAVYVNSSESSITGGRSISTTSSTYINLYIQSLSSPTTNTPYTSTNIHSDCSIPMSSTINDRSTHTITFTRVSGGTADGTFSGTVWPTSAPSQIVSITDGVFLNLPIL